MNLGMKIDRYLAVRMQSLGNGVREQQSGPPMVFLGGMSRVGNHFLHSLVDGHSRIKAMTEEDFLLRTNISSLANQVKLFLCFNFAGAGKKVDFLLEQNKEDFWRKICDKEAGEYRVDFDLMDYGKFRAGLDRLAGKRAFTLPQVYRGYIDCVLDATSGKADMRASEPEWKLYFTANADFLVRPILAWDGRNKAIIPVRDPLQRFGSHKRWQSSGFICTEDRLSGWKKVHRSYIFFKEKYKGRVLLVDYDDLVGNTERGMRRVAEFLGLDFEDVLTVPTLMGRPVKGNTSFKDRGKERPGEIYTGSQERYKEILTKEEIDIIEKGLRPLYKEVLS